VPCSTRSTLVVIRPLISLAARRCAAPGCALRRHHREAAALFAGTGGFHRRIQRQDVGLESDAVDHADDVGDLARASEMPLMV
jgi:hypothetical protein